MLGGDPLLVPPPERGAIPKALIKDDLVQPAACIGAAHCAGDLTTPSIMRGGLQSGAIGQAGDLGAKDPGLRQGPQAPIAHGLQVAQVPRDDSVDQGVRADWPSGRTRRTREGTLLTRPAPPSHVCVHALVAEIPQAIPGLQDAAYGGQRLG